ncbi:hypothetical protein QJS10_CPA09g01338 [Acorus calamus]|uniref:Uncharacterized protein n=1 Tax=Acorus calamus TaxID=4465 RepID=A0AAV9E2T8_ACOCL|nr:hypothetical protein QJS10_CPA09g01338 [Acorus calamus]
MARVVVVDLEYNRITTSEEIPAIPEPEYTTLRNEIIKLLHPKVVEIDQLKANLGGMLGGSKSWGEEYDTELR